MNIRQTAEKKAVNRAAHCPRCGRTQPDMIVNGGKLYTEAGHILVVAYVCSGCERIIQWDRRDSMA